MLTVKVFGDGTGLAFIAAWPLTRVTVTVTTHAGELVIVQVGSGRAVCIARYATQQRVWVQDEASLTLSALVWGWAAAAHTSLVALCRYKYCLHDSQIFTQLQMYTM